MKETIVVPVIPLQMLHCLLSILHWLSGMMGKTASLSFCMASVMSQQVKHMNALPALQEQVVRAMALAGESALAEETREQFGLSKDTLDIDSTEAAAQRALVMDTYLPLQLPAEVVFFVDDHTAVSRLVNCQST